MTPEELLALYSPFLVNWFLMWLTNVAESRPPPKQEEEEDPPILHNQDYEHKHRNHRHHHHHHHHNAGESVAEMGWNVSSFLRGGH
jgi:hypothetical protein